MKFKTGMYLHKPYALQKQDQQFFVDKIRE